ncbi:MAG: translation initiation factor IF-3 [Puniceicoccales bacterium]|jgi:translation initiation factor IF-3|nr:translation initiation factor IF-3 [Puniceicoccales bacterium]
MTNQQFHQKVFKKEYRPYEKRSGNFGKNFIRKNEKIKVKEVRVIDSDGQQLGIMQTFEAIATAKRQNLDLVEISPNANPPVCKILDFGKYKYCESKKNKGVPRQASAKTKEVKLRIAIDANDYNTKMRHAIEFLEHGNKLKLSLMFRGREMSHTELGFELVKKFASEIKAYGTLDVEPKLFGKMISVTLSPCAKKQIKTAPAQGSPTSTFAKILDANELLKLK